MSASAVPVPQLRAFTNRSGRDRSRAGCAASKSRGCQHSSQLGWAQTHDATKERFCLALGGVITFARKDFVVFVGRSYSDLAKFSVLRRVRRVITHGVL